VPADAFAYAPPAAAAAAFAVLGARLGCTGEALAHAILEHATAILRPTIEALLTEYALDPRTTELVGGGGGAAALVPYAARALGLGHRLARDAEVISPVGVALALVRDVVERTIPNAAPADVLRVRREAIDRAIASGADPAAIEATVEIDPRTSLVRAVASGATAQTTPAAHDAAATEATRRTAAARALGVAETAAERRAEVGEFTVHAARPRDGRPQILRRIAPVADLDLAVADGRATVRLVARNAVVRTTTAAAFEPTLRALFDETTAYGDVGRASPDVHLMHGRRLVAFGALPDAEHVVALVREELAGVAEDAPIALLAERRRA